jgi:hypothetical protein
MPLLKDVFDLERAAIRDIRGTEGEVIEVPLKPGKLATLNLDALGEDLAQFMCNFTGRGYALSRETLATSDIRYVREPGHEAFGLKLIIDGNRILVGRVAILVDETILRNYLKHLKLHLTEEPEKPRVHVVLPDDFDFAQGNRTDKTDTASQAGDTIPRSGDTIPNRSGSGHVPRPPEEPEKKAK